MTRALTALALLCAAVPALADIPGTGDFGVGAAFGGNVTFNQAAGATFNQSLNGRYFLTDEMMASAALGLVTTENTGTSFNITASLNYYLMRAQGRQLLPFGTASFGINTLSYSAGAIQTTAPGTGLLFAVGAGLEYFFNRNFSVAITEGLQLLTHPTSFAMTTKLGVNLFF